MHAFGANMPFEDPDNNGQIFEYNPRFPGQYFDRETNLHYNYFRYYEPETGRYISPDPIGLAGGINIFEYANSNAMELVDPTGENPIIKKIIKEVLEKNSRTKETKKGANRIDRKQVDDAAKQAGIPKDRRHDFGKYLEEIKRKSGRGGRDNFSFKELLDLAKEFKETQCQ